MENITGKTRYEWVDILKGIGITLVVLGHSIEYVKYAYETNVPFFWNIIDFWLSNFHMALFFMLSAYLLRKKELTNRECYSFKNALNNILKLLVPYIIFSCVFYFSKLFMGSNVQSSIELIDLLLIIIKPLSTLWFLYLLMIFYMIRLIIFKNNINNKIVLACSLLLCILSYYVSFPSYLEGTILLRFMKFSFYYAIGIEIANIETFKMNNFLIKHKKRIIMLCLPFLLLGLLVGIKFQTFSMLSIIMILFGVSQIMLLITLFINKRNKFISALGKNSLGIYLFHDYIVCAFVIILKRFHVNSSILIIFTFVFAICISYYLYLFCLKLNFIKWIFRPNLLKNGGKNEY